MKHKTPSPAVLRSCTDAARAADAHAQESAHYAEGAHAAYQSALNAAEASARSSFASKKYATEAGQTVRRLIIAATVATAASALAVVLSVFALYHAA